MKWVGDSVIGRWDYTDAGGVVFGIIKRNRLHEYLVSAPGVEPYAYAFLHNAQAAIAEGYGRSHHE